MWINFLSPFKTHFNLYAFDTVYFIPTRLLTSKGQTVSVKYLLKANVLKSLKQVLIEAPESTNPSLIILCSFVERASLVP